MTNEHAGVNRYWGKNSPPKSKAEFFDAITMPAPAGEGSIATIRMYGPIDSYGGWWGISASDVSDVLDGLPDTVTQIILRINSPGGEVFEAMSILNMLRAHKASVIGVIDGLAASAASVIAAGCDETVMSPGTQMMIHSPSSIVWGNAADMRKVADVLDGIEESIISIYRDKAGESAWGELLSAETWYTAQQAVEVGLADRVAVVKDAGETSTAGADDDSIEPLEGDDIDDMYQAARARLGFHTTGAVAPIKLPSSSEPGDPNRKENVVAYDDLTAGLRERLGVTDAAATDETLLAAVDEVLAEQSETPAAAAASIPSGTQLIEDNVLTQLRADAVAGREARNEQISARRDGIISDALSAGRISAASAPQFRAMLDADETAASAVISSLAANTVPVEEVGHSDTLTSADDSLYAQAGWGNDEKEGA
ncbi:peptidase [Microbacterium sp. CH12i]|uniref:head maturation protease, ClpP-related n=1 Tax=Microbacterium sp. CH12i TaxID=1479651 RepID=UPI000461CA8F|nr:head maturation protease, ClpP-related [Microbacterium sp. CH12i]KDA05556.1 peptidase [Microbacterium sp. CH12i]